MTTYKLKDLVKIVSGGTPSTRNNDFYGEGYIWVTPKDLSNNKKRVIRDSERKITKLGLEKSNTKLIKCNSILLSTRATIGLVAMNEHPICTNQGIKALEPIRDDINMIYLFYILKYSTKRLKNIGNGSIFKEINKEDLENFKVDIPSMEIQNTIVDILIDIEDLIENNLKLLKLIELQIRKLYLYFYYKQESGQINHTEIGKVLDVFSGRTPSKANKDYWDMGIYNWYTPKDASRVKKVFFEESMSKISSIAVENNKCTLYPPGSVFFSSRANIGDCIISKDIASANQGFIVTVPNEEIRNYEIYTWLKLNKKKIESMSNGSTFKEFRISDFKNLKIPIFTNNKIKNDMYLVCDQLFELSISLDNELNTYKTMLHNIAPRLIFGVN